MIEWMSVPLSIVRDHQGDTKKKHCWKNKSFFCVYFIFHQIFVQSWGKLKLFLNSIGGNDVITIQWTTAMPYSDECRDMNGEIVRKFELEDQIRCSLFKTFIRATFVGVFMWLENTLSSLKALQTVLVSQRLQNIRIHRSNCWCDWSAITSMHWNILKSLGQIDPSAIDWLAKQRFWRSLSRTNEVGARTPKMSYFASRSTVPARYYRWENRLIDCHRNMGRGEICTTINCRFE